MPDRIRLPLALCILLTVAVVYVCRHPTRLVSLDQPPDYVIGPVEIRLPRWPSSEPLVDRRDRSQRQSVGGRQ